MPPARYATAEPSRRSVRDPRDPRSRSRSATARGGAARGGSARTGTARADTARTGTARTESAARSGARRTNRYARQPPALSWVNGRAQIQRVRWDRVGRVALVIVLAVVALLYVQHAIAYLQARGEANHQQAIVKQLEQQNAALVRRQKQLNDPATIIKNARELGMVWMGERPYSVTGLPNH
jgi:cell division protein FtsB